MNLNGHTIHSSKDLGINQKRLHLHIMKPGNKLRAKCFAWPPTKVYRLLWVMGGGSQKVQGCKDHFGRLLGVFMFDFC